MNRVFGDAEVAARIAAGDLADVPREAVAAGLRLPLHDHLGLELVALRPAVVELPLTERVAGFGRTVHGGALATLVDVAANVAAATGGAVDPTRYGLVTVRLEVDFRAEPAGAHVRATARCVGVERRTARVECEVVDERGRVVASAIVASRIVPRPALPGGAER